MPSRRDGMGRDSVAQDGSARDPYELPDDDDAEAQEGSVRAGAVTGIKRFQPKQMKRPGGSVLGGSEANKKQTSVPSMFAAADKRKQVARLSPAGMINLGNTCYLNSVVQVLLHMPCFANDLMNPALERLRPHLPPAGVVAALQATSRRLKSAAQARPTFDLIKPPIAPDELRAAMGRLSSRWRGYAQQDAHEFLVGLLEGLQSEVLAAEAAASGRRRVKLSATRCPSARNLGGCLVHTWTCCACGHTTRAKEPFSCLSLQLPTAGAVRLQDLVAEYLKDETIDKNCDHCSPSAPVHHTAQHHLWRLPRVLVVHIKRFMPLPQLQPQPQQRPPSALEPAAARGGEKAGPGGLAAAAAGGWAADGQAGASCSPDTPDREPGPAAAAAAAQLASASGAAAERETSPVAAPYSYAKVHTVVEIVSHLDLSRHCDAAARPHLHLLEGVPLAALAAKRGSGAAPGGADPGCAAVAHNPSGDGVAAVGTPLPAAAGAVPETQPPGTGGFGGGGECTLDTAGGGSTCPSPSFLDGPNRSALQERTVQQVGQPSAGRHATHTHPHAHAQRNPHARSRLSLQSAPHPHDSECVTGSFLSTGAQAPGGGGAAEAPTPFGGVAANGGADWQSHHKQQRKGQPTPGPGCRQGAGSAYGVGGPGCTGVDTSPPSFAALHRAGGGGGDLGSAGHQPLGPPLAPPNSGTPTAVAGAGSGSGGGGAAAAASGGGARSAKALKALPAANFFGAGAATGAGAGGCLGGFSGEESGRPPKRMCVDGSPERRPSLHADPAPGGGFGSQLGDDRWPSDAAAMDVNPEDMTEEQQMQLALRLSLMEDEGRCDAGSSKQRASEPPAGASRHTRASSGPTAATAAASGHHGNGSGVVVTTGFGGGASLEHGSGGGGGGFGIGDSDSVQEGGGEGGPGQVVKVYELQDESPGGCGVSIRRLRRSHRPAESDDMAASGASGSGDENHDDTDDDGNGGGRPRKQPLDRREAARLPKNRRKRRHAHQRYPRNAVPDVAESPAVAPPQHQQQQQQQQQAWPHGGAGVDQEEEVNAPNPDLGDAEDQDPELAAALRASMQTYAEEAAGRRSGGGGAAAPSTKDVDEEWERVLSIPDADGADCSAAAAVGAGIGSTPHVAGRAASAFSTPPKTGGGGAPAPPPSPVRRRPEDASGGGGDATVPTAGMHVLAAACAELGFGGGNAQQQLNGFGGAGDAVGAGGGGAGSRANPLDLTGDAGGDDEDPELHKAIMLSLQEATMQVDGVPEPAGNSGAAGDAGAVTNGGGDDEGDTAAAPQPKVSLVADSDCEGESDRDEDDGGDTRANGDAAGGTVDGSPGSAPAGVAAARPAATQQVEAAAPPPMQSQPSQPAADGSPSASGAAAPLLLSQLARYHLVGVVRHKGLTPFSGHYVADVLVSGPNAKPTWYEHNDSVVSHVDAARVREDAAKQGYMLFFINDATREASRGATTAAAVAAAAAVPLPCDSMDGAAREA